MNISSGTIARTACLALALTNQILSATGHAVLPIEDSQPGSPDHFGADGGGVPRGLVEEQQLHPGRHPGRPGPAPLPGGAENCPGKSPDPLTKGGGDSTLRTRNFITFI